jgi:hypothetical protein
VLVCAKISPAALWRGASFEAPDFNNTSNSAVGPCLGESRVPRWAAS